MADTNETIADIIAEMRRRSDEAYEGSFNYAECQENQIEYDEASEWADRLEAAVNRERGDCAKLREAVGYILKYADSVACRDHDEHTRHYIDQIRKWAQSALAEPVRNCDIAQDWLHDLYVNFKPPASVKREMPPEWADAVMAFCRWLVAPATEQEGGDDADK